MLRSLEDLGKVHVIVSNGCVTTEAVGQFGGFSTRGEFFNVQSESLDMHIRWGQLGAAFAGAPWKACVSRLTGTGPVSTT